MSWKKLLMALPILAFGVATDARADKPCNLMTNPGVQEADEYLYTDAGRHSSEDAYVCGSKVRDFKEYGCQQGTKVIVTDKEPHYNGDKMYTQLAVWWCDENSSNTHWELQSSLGWVYNCSEGRFGSNKPSAEFYRTADRVYYCRINRKGNNYCVASVNSDVCYKDLKEVVCQEAGGKWKNNQCDCGTGKKLEGDKCVVDPIAEANSCERLNANLLRTGVCQCKEGYEWDENGEKCINKNKCNDAAVVCNGNLVYLDNVGNPTTTVNVNQQQQQQQKHDSDNTTVNGGDNGASNGGNAAANCRASRSTPEGRACCSLPNSVAKYNSSTKGCDCVDSSKVFKVYPGEVGRCVSKSGSGSGNGGGNGGAGEPVAVTPCDCAAAVKIAAEAKTSCAASSQVVLTAIMTINAKCPAGQPGASCDADELSAYVEGITSMIAGCSAVPVKPTVNSERLANAIANLDKYRSALDVSVWKDKEGNFNTSRLVSDSIAGVVLGTAGGLITSSVVKKNQIKSGFEDVVCTVGGQEVGSYGDEITVGIQ